MKTKLLGEKASNLTRIGVNTVNGVVHLDGVVDSVRDKITAEELARQINGVPTRRQPVTGQQLRLGLTSVAAAPDSRPSSAASRRR